MNTARQVAERKLGRKLLKEEVVHHIDRNKHNNSPENLLVFSNHSEHIGLHIHILKTHKQCLKENRLLCPCGKPAARAKKKVAWPEGKELVGLRDRILTTF